MVESSWNVMAHDAWEGKFGKSLCTYKRCWKWCSWASIQAWTHLILFINTFCRSACAQVHSDFPNTRCKQQLQKQHYTLRWLQVLPLCLTSMHPSFSFVLTLTFMHPSFSFVLTVYARLTCMISACIRAHTLWIGHADWMDSVTDNTFIYYTFIKSIQASTTKFMITCNGTVGTVINSMLVLQAKKTCKTTWFDWVHFGPQSHKRRLFIMCEFAWFCVPSPDLLWNCTRHIPLAHWQTNQMDVL